MVERFIAAASYVVQVIEAVEHEPASEESKLLDGIQVVDGLYISFYAIIKWFEQIRYSQISLECVSSQNMTLVLPMIEQIKMSFSFIQRCIKR